jgi:hypothetical protein
LGHEDDVEALHLLEKAVPEDVAHEMNVAMWDRGVPGDDLTRTQLIAWLKTLILESL